PGEDMYFPTSQFGALGRLLVRTRNVDPLQMAATIREVMRSIDPDNPVDNFRTLAEIRSESVAAPRLTAVLLGIFASLALVITAAGIFGVMALGVSQRTHEIGIRMALGATPGDVLRMVLRQGMTLVLIGLVLGAVGAVALVRVMSGLLFGVPPTDPVTYASVAAVLAAVAAIACLIPARRAATIEPVTALRSE
ncbi:MAG TPA: FtsX-like permease family protein, partial [Candidatus Acidoferrales bacterium]